MTDEWKKTFSTPQHNDKNIAQHRLSYKQIISLNSSHMVLALEKTVNDHPQEISRNRIHDQPTSKNIHTDIRVVKHAKELFEICPCIIFSLHENG